RRRGRVDLVDAGQIAIVLVTERSDERLVARSDQRTEPLEVDRVRSNVVPHGPAPPLAHEGCAPKVHRPPAPARGAGGGPMRCLTPVPPEIEKCDTRPPCPTCSPTATSSNRRSPTDPS